MPTLTEKAFIALQHVTPQHLLSRCVGLLASSRVSWVKNSFIGWFANRYQVNMAEAAQPDPNAYASFNDFFTRALKADARPLSQKPHSLVCPADGEISQAGRIEGRAILQAKGRHYSIQALLGEDRDWAERYIDGQFATVYLSPKDYHRVHMPCDGRLVKTHYIPGKLFSVNQATAAGVDRLFARNERLICHFETPSGPMSLVLVGAMIVAGIETAWPGISAPAGNQPQKQDHSADGTERQLLRGEEMGRFLLGSTVIVLLGPNTGQISADMRAGQPVQMGQYFGTY
ncbi:hypothetical protein GCM10011403_16570 [Pseudohongiella nitratireducens]|uniref:Phosphatidylserine decarboxylase proenzyme n=1 Tax=Pseudohongiella nitratireducens TaxID=1768907 RepID=A0A917GXE8_9GAMM|nr:archaetidylserine decarboxylase [Pseudohongiella nitratireducens]GGG59933.1 hypothetical protein GCM10011403_16570 [Pseudohongiella nitratireducens]